MKNKIKSDAPLTAELWFELEKTFNKKIKLIESITSSPRLPNTPLEPDNWYMQYGYLEAKLSRELDIYLSNFSDILHVVHQQLPKKEKKKIDAHLRKMEIEMAKDLYRELKDEDEDGPIYFGDGMYLHSDGTIDDDNY
jgi:hypothetical protein